MKNCGNSAGAQTKGYTGFTRETGEQHLTGCYRFKGKSHLATECRLEQEKCHQCGKLAKHDILVTLEEA